MKPILSSFLFSVLLFCSCGEMTLEPGQALVNIQDTKDSKIISSTGKMANLIPDDCQSLIIIEDVDTALYVVANGDTLGVCDAVYHDPSVPWGDGKNVIVVKDNMAYCFTVTINKDGKESLTLVALPIDGKATVNDLPNNQCGVRNMSFDDGSTHEFDFGGGVIE